MSGVTLHLTVERTHREERDVARLARLDDLLAKFPGTDRVVLRIAPPDGPPLSLELAERVECAPALIAELVRECGDAGVRVVEPDGRLRPLHLLTIPPPAAVRAGGRARAIETVFAGYRFRSRTEARWAVFFTTLGVRYEYEREGFVFGDRRYLPDFWLPDQRWWVEIKASRPSPDEVEDCECLAASGDRTTVVMLCGQPWLDDYSVVSLVGYANGTTCLRWGDGVGEREAGAEGMKQFGYPALPHRGALWLCPVCESLGFGEQHSFPDLFQCMTCDVVDREWIDRGTARGYVWHKGFWDLQASGQRSPFEHPRLQAAYRAARQARFEYGETPGRPRS